MGAESSQEVANVEHTSLDFSSNNLGDYGAMAFAQRLQVNKTLYKVNLNWNTIGGAGAKAIGEALKVNKVLQTLSIAHNGIGAQGAEHIAEALKENKECKLERLEMEWNQIGPEGARHIAKALKENKSLRTLYLAANSIGDAGARTLGTALKENKTLQTLNLTNSDIGDAGARALGTALKVNKTLKELVLRSNKIGDRGAQAFGEALQVNQSIERIYIQGDWIPVASFRDEKTTNMDLSHKGYDNLSAFVIASLLTVNRTLISLNLRSNAIGDAGAQAIADALLDHPSVTLLDFRVNNLSMESGSALAAVAKRNPGIKWMCAIPLDSLRSNNDITELDLSSRGLGPAEAAILAEFLKVGTTLQTLYFYHNNIGPDGAEAIGKALQVNQSIERIYIQGDSIPVASFRDGKTTSMDLSHKGYDNLSAFVIASLLTVNSTLISINLESNRIGPEGAQHIAKALQDNKTVIELRMGFNNIGSAGADALANMLKANKVLKTLRIGGNNLGDKGAAAFADALEVNTTLSSLSMAATPLAREVERIGAEGAKALADSLKVNKTLMSLELDEDAIGEAGTQAISELLRRNNEWARLHEHARSIKPTIYEALQQFTPEICTCIAYYSGPDCSVAIER